MIFITGDCHSDFSRFNRYKFPIQKDLTKDDYVIICGDFGGVWRPEDSKEIKAENFWLDWLENRPFTTLFVDGNHENFDRLNAMPKKDWHGGKVHEIRPSVLHLCRGEVFDIDGKKLFAFGGGSSHDISDGILDRDDPDLKMKIRQLERYGRRMYRVKGLSWWSEELPSKEEMENGITNLAKHNNKVDIIVTHSPAASIVALLGKGRYNQDILTRYLEEIRVNTDYTYWVSGHLHTNTQINDHDMILYERMISIPTEKDRIIIQTEEKWQESTEYNCNKKLSELKLRSFSGETSDLGNAEAKASVFQEVSYEEERE